MILAFSEHIESDRSNTVLRTRNARLAAIHSFFPLPGIPVGVQPGSGVQNPCDPHEKSQRTTGVPSDTCDELLALLDAPDCSTTSGMRNRAMLHLAFAAALRASPNWLPSAWISLTNKTQASILVMGKGRRERALPLWKETARILKMWLAVRQKTGDPELFLNATGHAMTRSGFEYILSKHATTAASKQPSIATKRVTPHVLRHYVSFLTMSGNVAGSAILMVSHRSQHVEVWRATRHSFLATSRSES